jgi:hypothetical protein
MPELGKKMRKTDRKVAYAERAKEAFSTWLNNLS